VELGAQTVGHGVTGRRVGWCGVELGMHERRGARHPCTQPPLDRRRQQCAGTFGRHRRDALPVEPAVRMQLARETNDVTCVQHVHPPCTEDSRISRKDLVSALPIEHHLQARVAGNAHNEPLCRDARRSERLVLRAHDLWQ